MAALEYDINRKPRIGMFEYYNRNYLTDQIIDIQKCFYVGDAAGRPFGWKSGSSQDHSDSDRKFAINNCLRFITPEEYFFDETPFNFNEIEFDPVEYIKKEPSSQNYLQIIDGKSLVILVGMPCSGKTFFVNQYFQSSSFHVVRSQFCKKILY